MTTGRELGVSVFAYDFSPITLFISTIICSLSLLVTAHEFSTKFKDFTEKYPQNVHKQSLKCDY